MKRVLFGLVVAMAASVSVGGDAFAQARGLPAAPRLTVKVNNDQAPSNTVISPARRMVASEKWLKQQAKVEQFFTLQIETPLPPALGAQADSGTAATPPVVVVPQPPQPAPGGGGSGSGAQPAGGAGGPRTYTAPLVSSGGMPLAQPAPASIFIKP